MLLSRSAVLVCLAAVTARAEGRRLPPEPNQKPSGLTIRVLGYDGSTNGGMTVEVKNPTREPAEFSAAGLFFVPDVDPDRAPQRLGAVGPFVRTQGGERVEKLTLQPGTSEELALDVYCIDSHRSSPTSLTPFRIGKERMPRQLTQDHRRRHQKCGQGPRRSVGAGR